MLDASGATVGYIIYDVVSRGTAFWHYDSAGDPEERLRVLAMLARKQGIDEIRFNRLHHNSLLARRLRTLNCYSESRYAPSGGWMIQVINLHSLFEKLAPVLSQRLANSHLSNWRGDLVIATRNERITLEIEHSLISVSSTQAEDPIHSVEGGEDIALLVIGTESPAETTTSNNTSLKGDAPQLIEILFPKQYPQMGNADL
ncbi:MAG: hypothetical protein ABIQ44_14070 [Chloroflexia bacterium]